MPANDPTIICFICNRGNVVTRIEALTFRQSSDKGYVLCRVMIPIGVCDNCGARSWDEAAEKIMDDHALQREYDKLP